jgi:hypothetical protein
MNTSRWAKGIIFLLLMALSFNGPTLAGELEQKLSAWINTHWVPRALDVQAQFQELQSLSLVGYGAFDLVRKVSEEQDPGPQNLKSLQGPLLFVYQETPGAPPADLSNLRALLARVFEGQQWELLSIHDPRWAAILPRNTAGHLWLTLTQKSGLNLPLFRDAAELLDLPVTGSRSQAVEAFLDQRIKIYPVRNASPDQNFLAAVEAMSVANQSDFFPIMDATSRAQIEAAIAEFNPYLLNAADLLALGRRIQTAILNSGEVPRLLQYLREWNLWGPLLAVYALANDQGGPPYLRERAEEMVRWRQGQEERSWIKHRAITILPLFMLTFPNLSIRQAEMIFDPQLNVSQILQACGRNAGRSLLPRSLGASAAPQPYDAQSSGGLRPGDIVTYFAPDLVAQQAAQIVSVQGGAILFRAAEERTVIVYKGKLSAQVPQERSKSFPVWLQVRNVRFNASDIFPLSGGTVPAFQLHHTHFLTAVPGQTPTPIPPGTCEELMTGRPNANAEFMFLI